jgi:hypothetical protein
MKRLAGLGAFLLLTSCAHFSTQPDKPNEFRQLAQATPLPVALDRDFQFRKTKLFLLGDAPGAKVQTGMFRGGPRDAAVNFEWGYRLYGVVTGLDARLRSGHYFDFFWRAKRDAKITVRLEYRQAFLRAFTQAREVDYPHARGSHKTSFTIVGDDFFDDGHVIAWRCVLIENGRIVAEDRSYLWR